MEPQTRIEGIIQKMIDANESEEDIAAVIKEFKSKYPDEVKTATDRANAAPLITELEGVSLTKPPEPTPEPPEEESFADKVLTWPNAVRFGASAIGDLASPTIVGPGIGGYVGEAAGRWLEGQPFDNSINMVEAGLNYIPGGGRAERTGLRGIGEQIVKSARGGAVQGAVGTVPRHQAAEGNLFDLQKWTTPGLDDFASQTAAGAVFGGAVGGASKVLPPVTRSMGGPVATAGRFMQDYAPISDLGTRIAVGAAGHSYGGPMGAVLGGAWGNPPKILTGIEHAAGRGLERIGNRMQDVGIDRNAEAIEDFWGGPKPEPVQPIEPTINQAPPNPLVNAPFHPSDVEALKHFDLGSQPVPPTQPTVNQAPLSAMDRYGMISEEVPEPGPPNVGTGSAFEKYMQAKSVAARAAGKVLPGEDAPMVDSQGNELSFNQGEAPDVAVQAGASVNPDMEIKWPRTPTPDEVSKMESKGFQFDSIGNIFRKLISDESGEFRPRDLWENVRQYFGRQEPSSNADWLNVELRARLANDDEGARIAREARGITTPFESGGSQWEQPDEIGQSLGLPSSNPFPNIVRDSGTPQELPSPAAPYTIDMPNTSEELLSSPPPIQMNHIWEGWDMVDRWNNLRSSAREAGNEELAREIDDQLRILNDQMDLYRTTDRDARVPLDLIDPTPFEQANAHLPPPRVRSNHGSSFGESTRSWPARHAAQQAERAARNTAPIEAEWNEPASSAPVRTDVQQDMDRLNIPPNREQWYRSLSDESINPPKEGDAPDQPTLGLHEINQLGEISNARMTDLDPDFAPKEYPKTEGEGLYQPKLKLRTKPLLSREDIVLLKEDLVKAPSNSLEAHYTDSELADQPKGKPGLTVVKNYGVSHATYRNKDGIPVAHASGTKYSGIGSLVGEKSQPEINPRTGARKTYKYGEKLPDKGLGSGRPIDAVLRGLIESGIKPRISGSISRHSRQLVEDAIRLAERALDEWEK